MAFFVQPSFLINFRPLPALINSKKYSLFDSSFKIFDIYYRGIGHDLYNLDYKQQGIATKKCLTACSPDYREKVLKNLF